jgi:outer membrane protein assembly factor BamA
MWLRHVLSPLALGSSLIAVRAELLPAQTTDCRPGAAEVRAVSFDGNTSIDDRLLRGAIETTPSSSLRRLTRIVGARHCLAEGAVLRDMARLMLFYRRKGFPRVEVDTAVEGDRASGVTVRFSIQENAPILVDSVQVRGVTDSVLRARLRAELVLQAGAPLDHFAFDASSAAIVAELRRVGYLTASARPRYEVDSAALRALAWIDATPGPRLRLGTMRIEAHGVNGGESRLPVRRIRRLTGLETGQVLGSQQVNDARSSLDAIGLFDEIRFAVDSVHRTPDGDAVVDASVTTRDGKADELRLRTGYGTLDCFRIQLQGSRAGAFRRAGRLEITASLSKVGIGSPLDFAPGLCSSNVRADPYSSRLNYYLGATYSQAATGRRRVTRSVSIYTERRSEYLAYLRTTFIGGAATLARSLGRKWIGTLTYDLSYGRTEAEPAVLCATFSACLAADREQFTQALPFGLLSIAATYDATDVPLDATRGQTLRAELRLAPKWLGTTPTQQVIGARLGGAAYFSQSRRVVLAARITAGVVNTLPGGDYIPQGERLFAGGASTVRGFRQNEIGSRVYLADSVRVVVQDPDTVLHALPPDSTGWRAVPAGGNTAVIANLEVRMRPAFLPSLVQLVAFIDAGKVWNRGEPQLTDEPLFLTPGVGARLSTPIGPIRLDVAHNRYAPPAGPAYRDAGIGYATAPLYCVSVGNSLPVTGFNQFDAEGRPIPPVQAEGPCPATFSPSRAGGFLDRLTIHFSVGQAF